MKVPAFAWRIWPLTRLAAILDENDRLQWVNDIRVKGLKTDEHGAFVLTLSHDIVPLMTEALFEHFRLAGGRNYVEYCVEPNPLKTASLQLGLFTLTLQHRFMPTPHDKRVMAEDALLELWACCKARGFDLSSEHWHRALAGAYFTLVDHQLHRAQLCSAYLARETCRLRGNQALLDAVTEMAAMLRERVLGRRPV